MELQSQPVVVLLVAFQEEAAVVPLVSVRDVRQCHPHVVLRVFKLQP